MVVLDGIGLDGVLIALPSALSLQSAFVPFVTGFPGLALSAGATHALRAPSNPA